MANAGATLRAGFTTVRDVGTYRGGIDVSPWNAIDQGQVPGARMAVAGPCVTKPSGGGEVTGPPVAEILGRGANFIKVIATGAVLMVGTDVGAMECSEAALRAAVDEAAKRGTYATAHAHGAAGIKAAVRAGVRSIEHGSLPDDEGIALMAKRGTWLVADIYNGDYIKVIGRRDHWPEETLRKNDETTETQRATSRKAVAAGVRIGYDADAGGYPQRGEPQAIPVHGTLRHDSNAGHPVRDHRGRATDGVGGTGRVDGRRQVGRSCCSPRASYSRHFDSRHFDSRAGRYRHQGSVNPSKRGRQAMSSARRVFGLAAALWLSLASGAVAQAGLIRGKVVDSVGASVSGAIISDVRAEALLGR